jgi:hypothetical protein
MSVVGRWERFCNWLEAKPWLWRYDRIWRGIQGDPPFLRRLWWTVTFPHVHHDDEGAVAALRWALGFIEYQGAPSPLDDPREGEADVDSYRRALAIVEGQP